MSESGRSPLVRSRSRSRWAVLNPILDAMYEGRTLRWACQAARLKNPSSPDEVTIERWAAEQEPPELADRLQGARGCRLEVLVDLMLESADNENESVQRSDRRIRRLQRLYQAECDARAVRALLGGHRFLER